MRPLRRIAWAMTLACLAASLPNHAQAGESDETILLIGVTRGSHSDTKLTKSLEEHLRKTGEALVKSSALTAAERLCEGQECQKQLGVRENAAVTLTVNVKEGTSFLTMALLDISRGLPVQEEAACDGCSAEALAIKLDELSDVVLRSYRERKKQPPNLGSQPVADPSRIPTVPLVAPVEKPGNGAKLPPQSSGLFTKISTPRKIGAAAMGAVAIGMLVQSIVWSLNNGNAAPKPCSDRPIEQQDCHYDNGLAMGIGYGATALLAGGIALTLFLPGSTSEKGK